ncbi:MAG: DUF367 family protein [Thermoplasmata archaeon]|nr:DUF367 family protein [Thermoplasmata archaeon]
MEAGVKYDLVVCHLNEDDPKKCTAKKLAKFGMARLVKHTKMIPRRYLLLSPFSKKALSPEDKKFGGIAAVDCSWKNAEEVFSKIRNENARALPYLIAANNVNYGKPMRLTTAEAFAASLYILGDVEGADMLMSKFKWGPHFLELNKEPLERYRNAKTSMEVVSIMEDYLPPD